jgi:hypothetical protein
MTGEVFCYSLHGRVLASDSELSFLAPVADRDADITLVLEQRGAIPAGTPWFRGEAMVIEKSAGDDLVVRFDDGTVFRVGSDGRSIALLDAPPAYTREDVIPYALGPVLGAALHLQGAVLLHAAAVVIDEKAVLFAGDSGSGKSTTATMLHRAGYRVLSDDLTEIGGANPYYALPSVAAIRLWPDVIEAMYGSAEAFPNRAPSWDKKVVTIEPSAEAREIAAILLLDAADRGDTPTLKRLAPREGWKGLIANAYTAWLPGSAMEKKIFDQTSALAGAVPIYAFTAPPLATGGTLGELLKRELR